MKCQSKSLDIYHKKFLEKWLSHLIYTTREVKVKRLYVFCDIEADRGLLYLLIYCTWDNINLYSMILCIPPPPPPLRKRARGIRCGGI